MATTKVIINGQEVIGEVEFIRSLLGFGTVSARTEKVKTEKAPKKDIPVNKLPFNEDLKPSKPKKFKGKGSKSDNFENFINACIKGEKVYPDDNDIIWKTEIMHIKGIGYIAVLDNFIKKDSYGVMVGSVQNYGGKTYNKNGFAFPTKKECQTFMDNFKVVSGKLRLQWNVMMLNSK